MNKSFLFPGQGSQKVGMGKEIFDAFPNARIIFEEINDSLNYNLQKIIFEGPIETLTMTENAQPGIMAVSIAYLNVLIKDFNIDIKNNIKYMAGHSLGEYTALAASNALNLAEVAKLLQKRGKSMQDAVPINTGSMVALMGVELSEVEQIVKEVKKTDICDIANHNTKTQIVLSGSKKAIVRAIYIAKERKIRAVEIPVSAPFHSSYMKKTADELNIYFDNLNFRQPEVDIISNYSAKVIGNIDILKELLFKQTFSKVRWYESILFMKSSGINNYFEIGYGNILTGMNKRIDKELKTFSINNVQDLEQVAKQLA